LIELLASFPLDRYASQNPANAVTMKSTRIGEDNILPYQRNTKGKAGFPEARQAKGFMRTVVPLVPPNPKCTPKQMLSVTMKQAL